MNHRLRCASSADVPALVVLRLEMFRAMGAPGVEGSERQENSADRHVNT